MNADNAKVMFTTALNLPASTRKRDLLAKIEQMIPDDEVGDKTASGFRALAEADRRATKLAVELGIKQTVAIRRVLDADPQLDEAVTTHYLGRERQ
jgi:hypothetical protein